MHDCYTSPEWAALVAAVRADPDSDLPRLAAADFLDDHGETERAELIRVMVAAHRAGDCPTGCKRCDRCRLRRRSLALTTGAEPICPPGADEFYARGFVEWVECTAALWVAHGDSLLAREPVRRVTLTTRELRRTGPDGLTVTMSNLPEAFGDRWPGVEFTMPEPAGVLPRSLSLDEMFTAHQAAQRLAFRDRIGNVEVTGTAAGVGFRLDDGD